MEPERKVKGVPKIAEILDITLGECTPCYPKINTAISMTDYDILCAIFGHKNLEEWLTELSKLLDYMQKLERFLEKWLKSLKAADFEELIALIAILLFYSSLDRELQLKILGEILEKLCKALLTREIIEIDIIIHTLLFAREIEKELETNGTQAAKALLVHLLKDTKWINVSKINYNKSDLKLEILVICYIIVLYEIFRLHHDFFTRESIKPKIHPDNCLEHVKSIKEDIDANEVTAENSANVSKSVIDSSQLKLQMEVMIFFIVDRWSIQRIDRKKAITDEVLMSAYKSWKKGWYLLNTIKLLANRVAELIYSTVIERNTKLFELQKIIRLMSSFLLRKKHEAMHKFIKRSLYNMEEILRLGSKNKRVKAEQVFLRAVFDHFEAWRKRNNLVDKHEYSGKYHIGILLKEAAQDAAHGLNQKALVRFTILQLGNFMMLWAMIYCFEDYLDDAYDPIEGGDWKLTESLDLKSPWKQDINGVIDSDSDTDTEESLVSINPLKLPICVLQALFFTLSTRMIKKYIKKTQNMTHGQVTDLAKEAKSIKLWSENLESLHLFRYVIGDCLIFFEASKKENLNCYVTLIGNILKVQTETGELLRLLEAQPLSCQAICDCLAKLIIETYKKRLLTNEKMQYAILFWLATLLNSDLPDKLLLAIAREFGRIFEVQILAFVLDLQLVTDLVRKPAIPLKKALHRIDRATYCLEKNILDIEKIRKVVEGFIFAINAEDINVKGKKVLLFCRIWSVQYVEHLNICTNVDLFDLSLKHNFLTHAELNDDTDDHLHQVLRKQLESLLTFMTNMREETDHEITSSIDICRNVLDVDMLHKTVFFLTNDLRNTKYDLGEILSNGLENFETDKAIIDRFKIFMSILEQIIYTEGLPPVFLYYTCMALLSETLKTFLGEEHPKIEINLSLGQYEILLAIEANYALYNSGEYLSDEDIIQSQVANVASLLQYLNLYWGFPFCMPAIRIIANKENEIAVQDLKTAWSRYMENVSELLLIEFIIALLEYYFSSETFTDKTQSFLEIIYNASYHANAEIWVPVFTTGTLCMTSEAEVEEENSENDDNQQHVAEKDAVSLASKSKGVFHMKFAYLIVIFFAVDFNRFAVLLQEVKRKEYTEIKLEGMFNEKLRAWLSNEGNFRRFQEVIEVFFMICQKCPKETAKRLMHNMEFHVDAKISAKFNDRIDHLIAAIEVVKDPATRLAKSRKIILKAVEMALSSRTRIHQIANQVCLLRLFTEFVCLTSKVKESIICDIMSSVCDGLKLVISFLYVSEEEIENTLIKEEKFNLNKYDHEIDEAIATCNRRLSVHNFTKLMTLFMRAYKSKASNKEGKIKLLLGKLDRINIKSLRQDNKRFKIEIARNCRDWFSHANKAKHRMFCIALDNIRLLLNHAKISSQS